jgi:hypothetical protein
MAHPLRRVLASSQVNEWFGAQSIETPSRLITDSIRVEYLVIGGGGGGGYSTGGGGGAGGYVEGVSNISFNTNYTVAVGAGGAGASSTARSVNGRDSTFGNATGFGGGGGSDSPVGPAFNAFDGGSGGGGGWPITYLSGAATQKSTFDGIGYGNDGGVPLDINFRGAGGGGAGEKGGSAGTSGGAGGAGGAGRESKITGSAVTRGGGGGSGAVFQTAGAGGSGGGGAGATSGVGTAGTANTGGGGGGGGGSSAGGAGGSGVVILRYPSSYFLTISSGLTSTTSTDGGFKVTTFTAGSGTISIPSFNPTLISGLTGWYDATNANSFTFSSGTVVSAWADLSSSARNITQGTVANQPTRNTTLGANALSALTFDGTNDALTVTGLTSYSGSMAIFIVADADAAANFGTLVDIRSGTDSNPIQSIQGDGTTGFFGRRRNDAGTLVTSTANTNRLNNVYTYWYDGTNMVFRIDGTQISSSASSGAGTTNSVTVGATRWGGGPPVFATLVGYFKGVIGEICIYQSTLTLANVTQIEKYLETKWM